jgi:hypothetical protein
VRGNGQNLAAPREAGRRRGVTSSRMF